MSKLPPLPVPMSVYKYPDDEWAIDAYSLEDMNAHYLKGYNDAISNIEVAACAERDARIAELERQLEEARKQALEEAAKVCDGVYYQHTGPDYGEVRYGITACSVSIREKARALKGAKE